MCYNKNMEKEKEMALPKADLPKEEAKTETPKSVKSVNVYDKEGNVVRVYTLEQGKDFAKKAKGYAMKKGFNL